MAGNLAEKVPRGKATRRRWRFAAVLVITSAVGVVGCTQLDTWQRRRIFAVETEPQRWWGDPPAGTEIYDLTHKNGETVRAWYWQAPDPNAATVLYLHGSRWNLNGSAFRFNGWTRLGVSMLAIDYRGFGDSSPRLPSEQSASEDAQLAFAELVRRQPDAARRIVYGHSLGGAIAIDLATQTDAARFAGLIIESTFTSTADMLGTLSWGKLPGARWLVTQHFASIDKIATLELPMLFLHGTADQVIPHTMSDALHAAARRTPPGLTRLTKLPGISHSGGVRAGAVYDTAVVGFIRDAGAYAGRPSAVQR